jgi:hypothetical protein
VGAKYQLEGILMMGEYHSMRSGKMQYACKVVSPLYSRRIRMSVLPSCSITLAVQILPKIKGVQKSDRSANLPISREVLENLPVFVDPLSEGNNMVENMYICVQVGVSKYMGRSISKAFLSQKANGTVEVTQEILLLSLNRNAK